MTLTVVIVLDEAPKDRSREKKKEQLDATKVSKRVKPIPKVRRIDRLA